MIQLAPAPKVFLDPMPSPDALVSPCCRVELRPAAACSSCGCSYSAGRVGIVCFVNGGHCTKLDDLDYDKVYSVGRDASMEMYRQCRRFLGDTLPKSVDTFLEFGAGTGLFTLGFLANTPTRQAIITDISAQMLAACRARLEREHVGEQTEVTYAMWDGELDCLREQSVDFVAGFSVLHHVLDYETLLATLCCGMRPGGRAIFLEPNINFHRALIDFMVHVAWNVHPDDPAWTLLDRLKVFNWVGENHANLKYSGDRFVLQSREDKHLFDPAQLSAAARRAGFASTRTVPFGDRHEAWSTMNVYINQLGLAEIARADLLKRCLRMMPGPFEQLSVVDRAPSFLLILDRTSDQRSDAAQQPAYVLPCATPDPDPLFRCDMSFAMSASGEGAIEGGGWILGDVDVRFVRLDLGTTRLKFPVFSTRSDVDAAINAGRHFPPLRSLFCGLVNVCEQRPGTLADKSASVVAVGMDGLEYLMGTIELAPGTVARLEGHAMRPLSISAGVAGAGA